MQAEAPPLSPFPSVRAQPLSPRRVSQKHSLYVSPHKTSAGGPNYLNNPVTYRINRSPSKACGHTHTHMDKQMLVHAHIANTHNNGVFTLVHLSSAQY